MYYKQVVLTSYMPIISFHMLTLYETCFISSTFFIFKNPKKVFLLKSQNSIILKNLKSPKSIKKTIKIVFIKVDFTKIR